MPRVPTGVFRAYDIRGLVDDELTEDVFVQIGRAFATRVRREGGSRIAIGRDGRLSSPEFAAAFAQGACDAGCDVLDAGLIPTPLLYFGLHHLDVHGGGEITASHNPPEYNGVKLCLGTKTIFGDGIQELLQIIQADDFESGSGTVESVDLVTPYSAMLKERIEIKRPLRIAVDAGNGVAGMIAPRLYRELGCEVEKMYCDVDGTFPNHHPDPTREDAVIDLRAKVVELSLDLGLGFDGDGDRVGIIDERGDIVWGDRLTILLARDLLERQPGATVIFDVKCSKLLGDDIAKHGGTPLMWKTGHSFIKQKMREEKALLAGEMSGHLFFGERFFGHDDAVYAGAKLLEILSKQEGPFSSLLADLPEVYSTPELHHDSTEATKFEICRRLEQELASEFTVSNIDGVRVEFDDGWGLARASNTGPKIVMRFEAQTPERMQEIRDLVEGRLRRIEERLAAETLEAAG